MTAELHQLRFASDATFAALLGGGLFLLAGVAMWADIRRTRRKHPDRVGWVPWLPIFFVAALLGFALLMMAIKGWESA
jgi:hypothetical protein